MLWIKDCRHFQNWNKCGSCTLIWKAHNLNMIRSIIEPTRCHSNLMHNQANTTCSLKKVLFSWRWTWWCPKHVESLLITNKHQITVTSSWFYYLPILKMHGHMNIKLKHDYFASVNELLAFIFLTADVGLLFKANHNHNHVFCFLRC
jgi:hypothetical protein